jgi:hypothetical protein
MSALRSLFFVFSTFPFACISFFVLSAFLFRFPFVCILIVPKCAFPLDSGICRPHQHGHYQWDAVSAAALQVQRAKPNDAPVFAAPCAVEQSSLSSSSSTDIRCTAASATTLKLQINCIDIEGSRSCIRRSIHNVADQFTQRHSLRELYTPQHCLQDRRNHWELKQLYLPRHFQCCSSLAFSNLTWRRCICHGTLSFAHRLAIQHINWSSCICHNTFSFAKRLAIQQCSWRSCICHSSLKVHLDQHFDPVDWNGCICHNTSNFATRSTIHQCQFEVLYLPQRCQPGYESKAEFGPPINCVSHPPSSIFLPPTSTSTSTAAGARFLKRGFHPWPHWSSHPCLLIASAPIAEAQSTLPTSTRYPVKAFPPRAPLQ